MLLMTLKGIKKMLDKALPDKGGMIPVKNPQQVDMNSISKYIACVENARDMLVELITELEKKPVAPPRPPAEPGYCECKNPEDEEGTCKICGLPIDYKSQVI